ncbi:MAG: 30S ribosomal protein S17 [Planctomycetes bacterium]|jgi:small subunit ribosomal protein S17|nr:30S ribosomal protein S17 [Planctomycetota bacterium]
MTATRNSRRTLQGVVTANAASKTITVVVERTFRHTRYGKFVRRQKKYVVHDEADKAQIGDSVEIVATRPISKHKRWRLGSVLDSSDFGASQPVGAELAEKTALETLEVTAPKKVAEEAPPEATEGGEE